MRVVYVRDGKPYQVTAGNVVMACFNNIIRYIVPELPDAQKEPLGYASKVPMQYTNVLVRNWEAWKKLGVHTIEAPNGYHTWVALDIPVSIGRYRFPTDPPRAARADVGSRRLRSSPRHSCDHGRWPHGYAYTYDTLGDPDVPDAERPHVLGRRAPGRIAIANADSGAAAFTNVAIDQAERAVQECLISRGLT